MDPIASIVVALFVAKVGLDILKDSANELMDYSIDEDQEKQIIKIAQNTPGVINLGEFRTRKHGATAYVDLTICVNKDLSVYEGHEIATKLEKHIIKDMQFVKGITVHVEPCVNCPYNYCKK